MAKTAPGKMRDGIIQRGASCAYTIRETDPTTGQRKTRWVSGFPTRAAAKAARDKARGDIQSGTYVSPSRQTLGAWLDVWLVTIKKTRKAKTSDSYTFVVDQYLRPTLGGVALQALTPGRCTGHWADRLASGGKGGRPLSRRTVQYSRSVLRTALNAAMDEGLVGSNAAGRSKMPSAVEVAEGDEHGPVVWTAAQVRRFIDATEDKPFGIVWRVALQAGLRRGELAGLQWTAVDLTAGGRFRSR